MDLKNSMQGRFMDETFMRGALPKGIILKFLNGLGYFPNNITFSTRDKYNECNEENGVSYIYFSNDGTDKCLRIRGFECKLYSLIRDTHTRQTTYCQIGNFSLLYEQFAKANYIMCDAMKSKVLNEQIENAQNRIDENDRFINRIVKSGELESKRMLVNRAYLEIGDDKRIISDAQTMLDGLQKQSTII